MKQHISIIITFLIITASALCLSFLIKGEAGNPLLYQKAIDAKVGGPFESTNSTSRYMLTQAIVENNTFLLSKEQARASAPDVVYYQGKFFSIFTPGVSFLAVPFYSLGKMFGVPQLVGYLSVMFFAVINVFLIIKLSKRLEVPTFPSIVGGLVFLFATNAFSYSLTMTQHHMTVTVLLLGILLALSRKTILTNIAFGFVCGVGILLDIPNAFFLLPIGLYFVLRHFHFEKVDQKIRASVNTAILAILIGILPLLGLFSWYNYSTTGSYTVLAQSIGQTKYFDSAEETKRKQIIKDVRPLSFYEKSPFRTRNELNSLYILFLSNERSWIFYSPIVFLGIIGLFLSYRVKELRSVSFLCLSLIFMNVSIYAMFGDPWGGWSFGPRYLIPSAAAASVGIGYLIWKLKKNVVFMVGFCVILFYSIAISLLGALTTNAIPPKVEAIHLLSPIPYTYDYNIKLLNLDQLSSLSYNIFFSTFMNGQMFYFMLLLIIIIIFAFPMVSMYFARNEK